MANGFGFGCGCCPTYQVQMYAIGCCSAILKDATIVLNGPGGYSETRVTSDPGRLEEFTGLADGDYSWTIGHDRFVTASGTFTLPAPIIAPIGPTLEVAPGYHCPNGAGGGCCTHLPIRDTVTVNTSAGGGEVTYDADHGIWAGCLSLACGSLGTTDSYGRPCGATSSGTAGVICWFDGCTVKFWWPYCYSQSNGVPQPGAGHPLPPSGCDPFPEDLEHAKFSATRGVAYTDPETPLVVTGEFTGNAYGINSSVPEADWIFHDGDTFELEC